MRGSYWRFSRPLRCAGYLCLLLILAWVLRLANGIPPAGPKAVIRRAERAALRKPGEITEILEEGSGYSAAVTWLDGELYTYFLVPHYAKGEKTHRYEQGVVFRNTDGDSPFWCTTPTMDGYTVKDGDLVLQSVFFVLVKQPDPAVVSGKLTVRGEMEGAFRTWVSEAKRDDPRYLVFRLEQTEGGNKIREIFNALSNGSYYRSPVTAEAEVAFFDEEGNEIDRVSFSMVQGSFIAPDLEPIVVEGSYSYGA